MEIENPDNCVELAEELILDEKNGRESVLLSEIIDDYFFIPLETSENSLIGRISKIQFYEGRIYILDWFSAKSLFVFSNKGEYLYQIGKMGNGPGEFLSPMDFTIDKNLGEIIITDTRNRQLLYYTLAGGFVKSVKLDYWVDGIMYCSPGVLALKGAAGGNDLILADNLGVIVNSLFPFKSRNESMMTKSTFQTSDDTLNLFYRFSGDTVYRIINNNVIPYKIFSQKKYENSNSGIESGYYYHIGSYIESGKHAYLKYVRDNPEKTTYSIFISNHTGHQKYFEWNKFQNDIFFHNSFLDVATTTKNNELVFVIQPHILLNIIKIYPELKIRDNIIIQILDDLKDTSNPILMVAKLKDF